MTTLTKMTNLNLLTKHNYFSYHRRRWPSTSINEHKCKSKQCHKNPKWLEKQKKGLQLPFISWLLKLPQTEVWATRKFISKPSKIHSNFPHKPKLDRVGARSTIVSFNTAPTTFVFHQLCLLSHLLKKVITVIRKGIATTKRKNKKTEFIYREFTSW